MSKKESREVVPPYKCIQSLELYNERMMAYRISFGMLLEYVKSTPNGNQQYQDHLIKVAEQNKAAIDEFHE